jgi:predicted ATPase/DNA-binding SARP family transcriptional activator
MQLTALPAGDIPLELTSFIGRERELAALRQLAGSARLITLTGAGGSGKSRLARQLAPDCAPAGATGVAWVELAPITDPALLPGAVLQVLDPSAEKGGNVQQLLIEVLRSAPPLLVLDNCEHLVDACAELADVLLRTCPELHVLATSREALSVPGERAWLVPPLALPPAGAAPDAAADFDAVRLFVERARDVQPDFELTASNAAAVGEICTRLDGIPLAIELAASRVRVMAPDQIRDRLTDAFALLTSGARTVLPRHRTLKAAIDWSYDLLPADARTVLQRLSVFRAGFTLDAAEAVAAGGDIAAGDVLDLVAALLDRSLLVMREHDGSARYMLLETMRQYAGRLLEETGGAEDVRRAMAVHYVSLVAGAEPAFTTTARRPAFARLDGELDNIREVLEWTHAHDGSLHVRLVGMLWWYWFGSRYWLEARRWITGALALPEGQQPGRERAALLFAGGALSSLQAQVPAAREQLTEAIRLAGDAGDPRLQAYACNYLGMTYAQVGDPATREHCARAEAWLRPAGDLYGLRLSLLLRGMGEAAAGDLPAARRLMEEAVTIARTFGQDRELGVALQTYAGVAYADGDAAAAAALLIESLAALRRDWSYLFAGRAVDFLGVVYAADDPADAARCLGAGDALRERVGAARFQLDQDRVEAVTAKLRSVLGDAGFDDRYAEGRANQYRIVDEIIARAVLPAGAANSTPHPGPAPAPAGRPTPHDVDMEPPVVGHEEVPDLQVTLFGALEVHVHGTRVESWSYSKPKEMLAFLLAHPRGRTRAEIGAAIWPDASPAQLRNSFHVTMHHLRRSIGRPDWVIVDSERYRLAPDVRVQTDVATFEREIRASLPVPPASASATDAARLRRALDLYRDHYLAGEVAGRWRDDEQDRLRALYTEAGLHLGAMLEAAGDSAAAVTLYEQLLTREPLLEEAHRRLIAYWGSRGDRVRAVRYYERLAARLAAELGLEPDMETTELYENIRG